MLNNLDEAIKNGAMQTGAVEFIVAYNPEHGFLGDLGESVWDMYLGGVVSSGNARQLRGFFKRGIKYNISFNIAAHSQGGLLAYRAMEGLDFSGGEIIDTGTVLFSGVPVDSDDFYSLAKESGFRVDFDLANSNILFQVNRPGGETSYLGYQLVDPVSDMPIFMGGNGSFWESLLSLPKLFDDNSPHSNYLCQGLTCADSNSQSSLGSARNKYFTPTIEIPPSK